MAITDPKTHTTSDSADSVRPLPGTDRASPIPGQEMERTVVVGIDGSDESRSALRWAVDYARRTDATVRAIAVWQQPLEFGMTAVPPPPRQAYEAEAEKWLTDALPTLEPTEDVARIRTRTEEGDPSSVLATWPSGRTCSCWATTGEEPSAAPLRALLRNAAPTAPRARWCWYPCLPSRRLKRPGSGAGRTLALVEVFLQRQGPFLFALDTGASSSDVDVDVAARLALPRAGSARPARVRRAQPVRLRRLELPRR